MQSRAKPFISPKTANKQKRRQKVRRIFSTIILLACIALVIYLARAHRFRITDIELSGLEAVQKEDVQMKVDQVMTGNRFLFVPKKHKVFIPRQDIRETLLAAFPRIGTVDTKISSDSLFINMTEREPAYLWCGVGIPLTQEESFSRECYFTDKTGFIFSLAPQFSEAVYPKLYTTLTDATYPVGQNGMNENVLLNVSSFADQIKSDRWRPFAYALTPDNDAKILLYRSSENEPPYVLYNPVNDPVKNAAGFTTAISTEPLRGKLGKEFRNLLYIDVRFPNKVFYKFKDEQEASAKNETTPLPPDTASH